MSAVSGFSPTPSSSTTVRLHPREHGAYAILGMPLLTALLIGGLTSVGLLTTVAAIAGFLANEPLLIVSGRRGKRTRFSAPFARRALVALLSVAIACGGLALWQGTTGVRVALVACGLLAFAGFGFSATGRQRSLTAQFIGIIGLTMPSAAVLLAGGVDVWLTMGVCSAWILGRIATTTSVRSVVARHKASLHRRVPRGNDLILVLVAATFVAGLTLDLQAWLTVSPLLLAAAALRVWPPDVRDIRQLGWRLLAVNVVSCLWMVAWYAAPLTTANV